jgi:outer membrane protein OmpA-like peptidoglycan-associated protein
VRRLAGAAAILAASAAPAAAQDVGSQQLRDSVETIRLEESIEDIPLGGSVEDLQVERERGGNVTLSVSSDVLFEFDRARLTPVARQTVQRLAERLGSARGPVRVEGHTDSLGSDAYNLRLSRRRAATVTAELRSHLPGGIAISARGFGESRPVAPNTVSGADNPEGRAKNRRVTIRFRRP